MHSNMCRACVVRDGGRIVRALSTVLRSTLIAKRVFGLRNQIKRALSFIIRTRNRRADAIAAQRFHNYQMSGPE